MISARDVKFCKDCFWVKDVGATFPEYFCRSEDAGAHVDPVDGEFRMIKCGSARSSRGSCKPEGVHWRPKEDENGG